MNEGLKLCECGCGLQICRTCGVSDCKWPGACAGKCAECGAPARASSHPEQIPNDMYCSDACSKVSWDRAEAEGRVVHMADISLEQQNELLKTMGLELAGVGPRKPS
jgi:predicted ATP-dependent serine protease